MFTNKTKVKHSRLERERERICFLIACAFGCFWSFPGSPLFPGQRCKMVSCRQKGFQKKGHTKQAAQNPQVEFGAKAVAQVWTTTPHPKTCPRAAPAALQPPCPCRRPQCNSAQPKPPSFPKPSLSVLQQRGRIHLPDGAHLPWSCHLEPSIRKSRNKQGSTQLKSVVLRVAVCASCVEVRPT